MNKLVGVKDVVEILRNRVEIKLNRESKKLMALARFKNLDEVLDFHANLPVEFKRVNSINSSWTFGDVSVVNKEMSREEYTDELLRIGDVMESTLEYIQEYKNQLLDEGLYDLQNSLISCKRKRRFRIDEGEASVERLLSGTPEVFQTISREGKKSFVNIGIQMSLSGGNGIKSFSKNCALAFTICEILENLGYGVTISIIDSCWGQMFHEFMREHYNVPMGVWNSSRSESGKVFEIKSFDDHTDIRNIACTSLPSLLRKYFFDIDNLLYKHFNGACYQTSQEYLDFAGIDLLIGKQWLVNVQVESIAKAIRGLIADKG